MNSYPITIIGAGLSGIMAAKQLKEQGNDDFLIVDKGKSVGGRLATRRVAEGKADHGAQFFTVRTEELQSEVDQWLNKGWVKRWFGDQYPRYTAVDGMNGLAKHLAEGLPVSVNTKVVKIIESAKEFILSDSVGNVWRSEQVLITTPVPQIIDLLKNSEVALSPDSVKSLRSISFLPSYVGIFEFNSSTHLPDHGHLDENLPDGVERIVDHEKKGISQVPIISVYMTGDWSRRHFGDDYVMSLIKENTEELLEWSELESEQLKRWRYSQAKKTINTSFMNLNENKKLLAAGDTFLREDDQAGRTRFESAFLSGRDAGEYLAK
ncbi:FAD-dependent oxidoreductase [Halobacillus salinarum]|uniref:FAD-dependent oxidoreductase n=1 Tax=Halobacillus salinarum TaxID=2932257 RepID=A0ABY4ENN0_9BACI|nr:FAD-dependent oxidoreductase [Halobacillus salinarum]UOQ45227.1 FAD-dependent oxidoreductase [Halobacillus salinarum]